MSQVGTDRIIEFIFSDGQYRLFLEFYASGNIILADKDLNILSLLRIVPAGDGQEEQRVGLKYSLENRQNYGGIPPLTKQRLHDALQKAADRGDNELVAGKKQKKKGADALRKALAVSITEFPPMLVDHAMRVTNFDSTLTPSNVLHDDALLDHLMRSLQEAQRVIQEITSQDVSKGYIIAKPGKIETRPADEANAEARKNLLYEDFHPFKPRQFEDDPTCTFIPFDGFNATVDEFFSSIEGQKLESRLHEREMNAKKKLEAARQDQAKRLGGLQEVQELNITKAGAIEANVERVQEAMDAVNGLIAQGMDWVEIGKLIELEQKRNNSVAKLIRLPLKLHENTISLLLDEEEFEEEEDSAYETDSSVSDSEDDTPQKEPAKDFKDKRLVIDINLGESPWSNAREYYDQRRSAVLKEQKTLQSSSKALKSTEQKIAQDLKKGLRQEKAVLRPVRRQMWFEKFIWFISSDGYMVLGGRDAQQNETLYKKYLRKGDVYVHADLQGAATVVIRNNPSATHDAPIPPSTLSQAGTLAVAASSAWDSKAGMSAWWVNADQVSKSAPAGEFLPTGSFMIRGKKNFLPPSVLLLGFAVMFHISDDSKARHTKHRIYDDAMNDDARNDEPKHDPDSDSEDAGSDLERDNPLQSYDTKEGIDETPDLATAEPDQNDVPNVRSLSLEESETAQDGGDDAKAEDRESSTDIEDNAKNETANDQGSSSDDEEGVHDKGSNTEDKIDVKDERADDEKADQSDVSKVNVNAPKAKTTPPAPRPRAKTRRAKRIAAKYKDQDEEDRLAAQQLIGATAGRAKAEAEAKAKAQREAEHAFQKERRRAQHLKEQKEIAKYEEIRQAMLAANEDVVLDDDEVDKMTSLDAFVGTPLPGDEILEAIPVCAPWAALGKYKYKAKLQPGAQKKGKAIKEILSRWVSIADAAAAAKGAAKIIDPEARDVERMWPREIELVRAWKPEECTNVVPVGKVRVMVAGGTAGQSNAASKGKARGGRGSKKGGR